MVGRRRPDPVEARAGGDPAPQEWGPRAVRRIGHYVTRGVLGEGAMGTVYRAENKTIGRMVAIKLLHADLCRRRDLVDRFVQEARAASAIDAPHIVEVIDYGELPGGQGYLVMELLEGRRLSDVLADKPFPIPRAVHVARGIAAALGAAHAARVVHRDLSPDNVMLVERDGDPDFVKVLDFGVAKLLDDERELRTQTGVVLGTPAYMAPEQARGVREVDHRADVYSLGVVLYRMVTGRLPFEADGLGDLLLRQMTEQPVPPSSHRPDVPRKLEQVVMRALEKAPGDRFLSITEMDAALRAVERGEDSEDNDPPSTKALVSASERVLVEAAPTRRRRLMLLGLASSAAAIAAIGTLSWRAVLVRNARREGAAAVAAIGALSWSRPPLPPVTPPPAATVATQVAATPGGAPPPPQDAPSLPSKAAPSDVLVHIEASPPLARLELDGEEVSNPFDGVYAPSRARHLLVATAPGYRPERRAIVLDRKIDLKLELRRSVTPSPSRAPAPLPSPPVPEASPREAPRPTPLVRQRIDHDDYLDDFR